MNPQLGYPILWWIGWAVVATAVIIGWCWLDRRAAHLEHLAAVEEEQRRDVELELLFREQRRRQPATPFIPDYVPEDWT